MLHNTQLSGNSSPRSPLPSKQATISNSKKGSNKSQTLTPLTIALTQQNTSLEKKVLPKPETVFLTDDREPVITFNTPTHESKALPKPETPFLMDDGGNLPVPELSSPLQSEPDRTPMQINEPMTSTDNSYVIADYQELQQHRGNRLSDSTAPPLGREALPDPENPFCADGKASIALAGFSGGGDTTDRVPYYRERRPFEAGLKNAPGDTGKLSPSRRISGIQHITDKTLCCDIDDVETVQRDAGDQSPSGSRACQGSICIKAQTALRYEEDDECAIYIDFSDQRQLSWLGVQLDELGGQKATLPMSKEMDVVVTGSPPSTPKNKSRGKSPPYSVQVLESSLKDVIDHCSSAAETDENKKCREEAKNLLKISPGKQRSELLFEIVKPEAWASKVRQFLGDSAMSFSRQEKKPQTISDPTNDETSPVLMSDISSLEAVLRNFLDRILMKIDSEKKRGSCTTALHINVSNLDSLLDGSPRFQSSPTQLELKEWADQGNDSVKTSVSLLNPQMVVASWKAGRQAQVINSPKRKTVVSPRQKDEDTPKIAPGALADITATVARLESMKKQQNVQQEPRQSRLMSNGEGIPTPSSPDTLGRRTPSGERAGPSLSPAPPAKSHSNIKRLAAVLDEMAKSPTTEKKAKEELGRLRKENLEEKERNLKNINSDGSGGELEHKAAEALMKMSEHGQIKVQDDMLEEEQDVNGDGTSSTTVKSYEAATEDLDEHGENQVSKAEDTVNDGEEMRDGQFQAQEHEDTPVATPSEARRKYSILGKLFSEEELIIGASF